MNNPLVRFFAVILPVLLAAACGLPPLSTEKAITAFSFTSPSATGSIDENARTISVTVPHGTNVNGLVASFVTTGVSVAVGGTKQESGVTANDFTSPVQYVVTAADGSTATYTVTVTVALDSSKALTLFILTGPVAAGSIDEIAKTVSLAVPFDANLGALVAAFVTTGAQVTVNGITQQSGVTANDFTDPVQYTVTAADGSTATYTVTVTKNAEPAQDVCLGGTLEVGQQDLRKPVTAGAWPGLALTFGTKKTAYGGTSACVPVYLEIANRGTTAVTLSDSQVNALSALSSSLYGANAVFTEILAPALAGVIGPGTAIGPGEHIVLQSLVSRNRITLYSTPPLGGGTVTSALNVQGPFGAPAGTFGINRLDFAFDLDFGSLPPARVADPGAGVDFVEGQLLVTFNAGTTLAEAEAVVAQLGCHIKQVTWSTRAMTVLIPFDRTTGQMITDFTAQPNVNHAERNPIVHII